jgi:hypothetical protein
LSILPLIRHQTQSVIDTADTTPTAEVHTASSPLFSLISNLNTVNTPLLPVEVEDTHTPTSADASPISDSHTHTPMLPNNSDTDSSSYNPSILLPQQMSVHTPAECVHAEPKCIPLLTPGEVSPMVMCQWEMACEDFFSANKKLEDADHICAVLPSLKDMHAHNWVATH